MQVSTLVAVIRGVHESFLSFGVSMILLNFTNLKLKWKKTSIETKSFKQNIFLPDFLMILGFECNYTQRSFAQSPIF